MTHDRMRMEGRLLKLSLIGAFLASIGLAGSRPVRRQPHLSPTELGMLGLATYRIGHMIAYERVATPLREPFTRTVPDETGAGETVVARGTGVRWVIGELLSCPVCVGTWAAIGLYIGLSVAPRATRMLVDVLGTTGIAELANAGIERLTWSARAARAHAGDEDWGSLARFLLVPVA